MPNIFNPENYTSTLYGLPVFIVGVAIISLGFYVLVRERSSAVGASFLFLCLSVGLYLVFSGVTFASPGIDNTIALLYSRVANLGAVWIPTSILLAILVFLGLYHKYRLAIAASAVVSTLFSFGLFFTDLFIHRIEQFFWGKYSQYGPLGYAFVVYFFLVMLMILPLLWHSYQHAATDQQKKRYRGILIAFIGGYLGSADFLPAFGIPLYPFGYLTVGFFIAVSTYVILRYQLVDITPELAAGQILETMQSAVIVTAMDGTIRVVNKVAADMLGCMRSELIGSDLMSRVPVPLDLNETVKAGTSTAVCEMVWQGKQTAYDVRLSASLLSDNRGSDPVGIVYVASDITENKRAQEAVRMSEERLRLAHSSADQYWFDMNVRTGESMTSPEYAQMLGYDPAEFATNLQIWFDNIHPDDRPSVQKAYQECIRTGESVSLEYRRKNRSGDWKWISTTGKVVEYDGEHKPLRMIGVHADITARKRSEEALRESEERFRSLFEKVHVVALVIDPSDGAIIDANPAASTFYGWSHDELLARKITDINMLSRDAVRAEMEAAKNEKRSYFLFKHRTADGAIRDVEVYSGPLQSGERTVLYSIIHDITERKKAADSLVNSLESYRGLFNGVVEAIYVMDRQGRFIDVNESAERMYGLTREQLIGRTPGDVSAPGRNDLNATMTALANAFDGQPQRFEFWGQRANGEPFPKEVRLMSGTYFGQEVVIASADDITERKKVETEREQFYKFFQTSADIMVIADPNGAFLKTNPACTEMLGYAADELVAKPFVDFIHPEDKQPTLDEMARQQNIGFSFNFENRYLCKDGSFKLLSWQATYSKEEGVTYATARDITSRRQTEAALQESKKLFELLFSTSPDAALISRLDDGIITNINDVFIKLFGYSRDELVGNKTLNLRLWAPEDRQRFVAALREKGFCRGLEFQFRRKDGNTFFGSLSANVTDIDGVPHIVSNTRDITERKLAEEQLKDAHGRLIAVLNGLDAVVYVADMNTYELLFINDYIKNIFGDISGKQCWKTLQTGQSGPCSFCTNDKLLDAAGKPTGIYQWEFQNSANGRWYDIRDRALHWVDGRIVRMEIATDITERKQAEERIQQLAVEQRTILNTMAIGVIYVKERRIVWTNPGFDRIHGYAATEAWGSDARRLYVHEEDYERVGKEGYAQISSGGVYTTECLGIRKDGRQFWLRMTGSAVNPEDLTAGSIWMIEDIHEKKQAEEALVEKTRQLEDLTRNLEQKVREEIAIRTKSEQMLVQQSKMAAMGEMLGAIAHQWRQPLNALGLIIQNIRDSHTHGELDRDYIERAVQKSMSQVQRMSKTIDDFRLFFQPDKEQSTFDIMEATGEVLSLLSAQLAANDIDARLTCLTHGRTFDRIEDIVTGPENTIRGFRNEFEHMMMNLINNAREAIIELREIGGMGGGARGLITTTFASVSGMVVIEVHDNGCGIPENVLHRIFEPYFTTKDPAKGTGLGLYMSKVIVEDHMHGTLRASNSDQGAVFTVELPRGAGESSHQ